MKFRHAAAAVVTTGTLLASGGLALGAAGHSQRHATPQGGKINVFVTQPSETKGTITVTGAIGDYGTIISTNQAGKVDANGDYNVAHLKHGTFTIDSTQLDKKFAHLQPIINSQNCSATFSAHGPTTLIKGTGDYTGISGTVTVEVTFAGIAGKKANGKCNFANNAPTYGAFSAIIGSGTVSFK